VALALLHEMAGVSRNYGSEKWADSMSVPVQDD